MSITAGCVRRVVGANSTKTDDFFVEAEKLSPVKIDISLAFVSTF